MTIVFLVRNEWAKRVRAARRAKGWSQRELGERASTADKNVSQQTIAAVEAGLGCSDDTKVCIAAALGEHPANLFPLLVDEPKVVQAS